LIAYILDASVAAKWVLPPAGEPNAAEAHRLLRQYTAGEIHLTIPSLFWPETANLLWKSARAGRMSPQSAHDALAWLQTLGVPEVPSHQLAAGALSISLAFDRPVYDAIYLGSQELAKRQGRKVLVLVSDGGDTAKSTTYPDALEQALRGEVMIYSIIDVPIEASAGRDLGGEHALITLAEQTGGKSFYADSGGLTQAFDKVSDDLRTQYLLGYYPRNQVPGLNFHRVAVTISRPTPTAFNIRSRTGYYSGPPAKPRHIPVD
jgi:VWFA-related protein